MSLLVAPHRPNADQLFGAFLAALLFASALTAMNATPTLAASGDSLSGKVFRDEAWDGAKAGDLGEAGIEVTVTDSLGTVAGTYTSDSTGNWSTGPGDLDAMTGPYLVRFSIPALKAPLQPGPIGTDMRSNVQVVAADDAEVDFGVVYPYHYCQSNPDVTFNCFIEGDQSTGGDVLVRTEYLASGDGTKVTGPGTDEFKIADATDIGTTWGLAVQTFNDRDASNDRVWAAAMEKRFAGYGPSGPDAIYLVNPTTGTIVPGSTITSVDAGTDQHDFSLVGPGPEVVDAASFGLVGKQGWGDLDLNDEQDRLYAVNLFDRRLYEFDVDPTSAGYRSTTNSWSLLGLPGQACAAAIRPWAVGFNEGEVFVGTTCDDASFAYVHSLNPAGSVFVNELAIDLSYQRQPVGFHDGLAANWNAWTDTWRAEVTGWGVEYAYPQPMLTDIEFDRDALILGIRDRYGDQAGSNDASPNYPSDPTLYVTDSAGDILRACGNGSGGYVLEGGTGCAVTNGSSPLYPNAGPGGNEWYDGDNYLISFGDGIGHDEISLGGLAIARTRGDVLMTAYDALDDTFFGDDNHAFSSGLARLDNTTGDKIGQFRVYGDGSSASPGFGKAAGLGDLEAFCEGAPVMIGNYVWLDSNTDGLQGADEEPLAGVAVTLYAADGTTVVDTTSTLADGSYAFEAEPNTDYVLGFDPSGASAPITAINPSLLKATFANRGDDGIDSDVELQPSGQLIIDLTTGSSGTNDYTHDAGFVEANHRVGNLIWLDSDDSATADDGEPGIGGLDVRLFIESGDAPGLDAQDQLFGTTSTDLEGNYWFDGLVGQTYYIGIPSDQSGNTIQVADGSGPQTIDVAALSSSTGISPADGDADNRDDGDPSPGFLSLSGPVAVTNNSEPTGEADSNADPDRNAEAYVEAQAGVTNKDDNDSNLTVDFGFYPAPRIGGLLWLDGEVGQAGFNNGTADPSEASGAIGGATVQLWEDADGSSGFSPALDTLISTTTTDSSGNYYFTAVDPADYFVAIPVGQTGQTIGPSAGDLADYGSSTGQSDTDSGGDDLDDGDPLTAYASVSGLFTVELGDNPTNEGGDFDDPVTDGAEDDANTSTSYFVTDDNSDLSIDFGFIEIPSYEIGNLVWNDTNHNGTVDNTEPGIPGVLVELWQDTTNDGTPDTYITNTNTNTNGNYTFTGLPAGNYAIVIPNDQTTATNPTALNPYTPSTNSTETNPNNDTDNNTNGLVSGSFAGLAGNSSGVLSVGEGADLADEPTDETDESPSDEVDSRSNLTVDFGYYSLRLGNQVWIDDGAGSNEDNGIFDADESGVQNVTVELWEDSDGSGSFNPGPALDTLVAVTTTDSEGNYWFEGLVEGTDYIVAIPDANNTGVGQPLEALRSSTGQTAAAGAADNRDDGAPDPGNSYAAVAGPVDLTAASEPTGEADTVPLNDDAEAEANVAGTTIADANSNLFVDFSFVQAPSYEIGNLVWNDTNHNGTVDNTEPGIPGVLVELWQDTTNDGTPDTYITNTNTNTNGNYTFTGLPAGNYAIVIPNDQTTATNPTALNPYTPSTNSTETNPNNDTDNNTNGLVTNVGPGPIGNRSGIITVGEGIDLADEPTDETDESPSGLRDDRSNLTVDFGYYRLSLGNQVWIDDNNNGTVDLGEAVVPSLTLELYVDADSDGDPDSPTTPVATTVTDSSGQYLFTGLEDGQTYVVVIPASEFGDGEELENFVSSIPTEADPNDDGDLNDNGTEQPDGSVRSGPVTPTVGGEPGLEDPDNDPDTPDDAENLTVDFGFYQLSIGNQVWFDNNNDGAVGPGEGPVVGVTVQLWEDTTGDGTADTLSGATTTDASGLYLFEGLAEGDYSVVIPASEFAGGEVLEGHRSSAPTEPDPNTGGDGNDNGIRAGDDSVASPLVELRATEEPVGEPIDNDPNTPDGNENLTIDFGFYQLRLGNQVWADIGAGNNLDNGRYDSDESGIEDVIVELWIDTDDSGDFDPLFDTFVGRTTTDAEGNYWFDSLVDDGTYIVAIPEAGNAGAGQALEATSSSNVTSADPNAADNDDDGTPQPDYRAVAAPVTVNAGAEPVGESDTNDATNAEIEADAAGVVTPDSNSNLRIDFGFVTPPVFEIGNLVWADDNNNGTVDAGEAGIEGVLVELWRDTDSDGIGDILADSVSTGADGTYVFDMVFPGDYLVMVPDDQTAAADPSALDNLVSSDNGEELDPDGDVDSNDNGVNEVSVPLGGPVGISSNPVTVGEGAGLANEPTDETDESPSGLRDDRSNLSVDFGFYGLSLGNMVWNDLNNNGTIEIGEPALDGIRVNLWTDPDSDGVPDALVATTTTGVDGLYLFEGLSAGNYVVEIPSSQFELGAELFELHPSDDVELVPDTDVDGDNNGSAFPDGAVRTGTIVLAADSEQISEDPSNDTNTDRNSNLTADFGFYSLTLGNNLFFDTDADGTADPTETGVPGAVVNLWEDTDADGTPDLLLGTTTTDAGGHYLFTGLAAGRYVVEIPESNFAENGPLDGWISSTGGSEEDNPNSDVDLNDNGVDPTQPGQAVLSNVVTLSAQGEPIDESDVPPGHDAPFDDSSNLTVDFGFYNLSLGNRIWNDANNNGEIDPTEEGIANVVVELFTDNDGDGIADDNDGDNQPDAVQTTVTGPDGFYRFEGLFPGSYVVGVPAENFDEGGPLERTSSSVPTTQDPEDNADSDDNGINPATIGDDVFSLTLTLTANSEPTTEEATASLLAGLDDDSNLTVDFGFFQTARLGNYVWFDSDRDGEQDANETGVSNVLVELLDQDGDVVSTVVTNSDGFYIFDNIVPGDYSVRFVSTTFPTGFTPTVGICGCGTEADSNVIAPSTTTPQFSIGLGGEDLSIDLGLIEPPPTGILALTGGSAGMVVAWGMGMLSLGVLFLLVDRSNPDTRT